MSLGLSRIAPIPTTPARVAIMAAILASLGLVVYAGFTVDDALIPARMANNIRLGLGYRFNQGGELADGATALGWAPFLALFSGNGPLAAWNSARAIGAGGWVVAAAWLGWRLSQQKMAWWVLALLPFLGPTSAWAQAGLETGVVLVLATFALAQNKGGLVAAGLAAGLRPELIPFCTVLAFGQGWQRGGLGWGVRFAALGLVPAVTVAALRLACFGYPAPLAFLAKPADVGDGIRYVLGGMAFTGPFWLWLRPGWLDLPAQPRWMVAAIGFHLAAIALAGGDWMAMYRLLVPVLPATLYVAAALQNKRRHWSWALPAALMALAACVLVMTQVGFAGRRIVAQRLALIDAGRPLFAKAHTVAAVDIGWVGMAAPRRVLDLAGVTDEVVARLPGGHTSKQIPLDLLWRRGVDTSVLLLAPDASLRTPWHTSRFARRVENRVAWLLREQHCSIRDLVPLRYTHQSYLIVECRLEP